MQITKLIGNGDGAFTRESETSPFRQGQIIIKISVSEDLELQQLLCCPPSLFYPLLLFVYSGPYESACYVFLSTNKAFLLLRLHFNSDGPRYSPQNDMLFCFSSQTFPLISRNRPVLLSCGARGECLPSFPVICVPGINDLLEIYIDRTLLVSSPNESS